MADLQAMITKGSLIVDVRTQEEFEEEHFPSAINISVEQIQSRLNELGDKGKPVILYCASGARSAYAARILRNAGFTEVVNAGGLYDMPGY